MKKKSWFSFGTILFLLAGPLGAATLSVSGSDIILYGDSLSGNFGLGTSSTYSALPNASLTYKFPGPGNTGTLTPMVNGSASDYKNAATVSPMMAVGSGLGAYLETTRSLSFGVLLTAHYEIVSNPMTGAAQDTAMLRYTYTNSGSAPATVGLRLQIDTMVNSNDGANISVNNGISTVPADSLYRSSAGNVPPEWWDYDQPPPGPTALVGHGSAANNPYGAPATPPDAMEVGQWSKVSGSGQWIPGTPGTSIKDSSLVLWWTGTGDESNGGIVLAPGQSVTFTTYYGINQLPLTTATPTATATATATATPCGYPGNTCTPTPTSVVVDKFFVSKNLFTSKDPVSIDAGTLSDQGRFSLKVYNTAGEQVRDLEERQLNGPWEMTYVWDGTNQSGEPCASGVYLICLEEPLQRKFAKVLLVR